MTFMHRRRESCRRECRGFNGPSPPAGQGSRAVGSGAQRGDPPAEGADTHKDLRSIHQNLVSITGVLVAGSVQDLARDGSPITVLQVAFPAPDQLETDERAPVAVNELEVPTYIVEECHEKPCAGQEVLAIGRLSGGGGVLVTDLYLGAPPSRSGTDMSPGN